MVEKEKIREEVREKAQAYLDARKEFLDFVGNAKEEKTEKDSVIKHYISGNDNIIGRIGEFIAIRYYEYKKRNPRREDEEGKSLSKSNPAYDLMCNDSEDDRKRIKVSVKMITDENTRGRTTRVKWGEIDELIVIYLKDNTIETIGLLTKQQFEKATKEKQDNGKNKEISENPYCTLSSLNPKGRIGRYGTVLNKDDLQEMNLPFL